LRVTIMPNDNILTIPEVDLHHIDYAFFTNENGQSDAGYLIDGQKTRNVNIYSSEQPEGRGFDPSERVLANIQTCFEELGAHRGDGTHKFFMSSYYANMGKGAPLIISCDNLSDLEGLKRFAADSLYYEDEDKTNPKRLGLEPLMRRAISTSDISLLKADALIFKGIPGESIAVLGASGDAHPIMMFDDENKIACYIAGAHMAIKQGVLEQSFDRMLSLGASAGNIRFVIGPGLAAKSYEFGENAPEYFSVPEALTLVRDTSGAQKYLVDIHKLVAGKLEGRLPQENIFNIALDTMGFDLYDSVQEEETTKLKRKTTINFADLNESGTLFFGARRTIMEQTNNLIQQNSGAYNTVGRHAAGFRLK
jgi:copper oxidase (laccase) domain-containing protein